MDAPEPLGVAPRDEAMRDAVTDLVSRLEETEPAVFTEVVSDVVAIDVLFFPPTPTSTCWNLVTSGMSDLPMPGPQGDTYAELTLALPRNWPTGPEAFEDDDNYWPVRLLRRLARYPHEAGTALLLGQLVAFGEPAEDLDPLGEFNAVLIGFPLLLGDEATKPVALEDGRAVRLLSVLPLRPAEYAYAREHGNNALYAKMSELARRDPENELTEYLDLDRPDLV